jgi:choline monooxygenase
MYTLISVDELKRLHNEIGPYHSLMEDGMQHFHKWYRGRIGANARRFLV